MSSRALRPTVRLTDPEHVVVVDEIDRTARVFADDVAADCWCSTGEPTYLEVRDASDDELDVVLCAHLGSE